MGIPSCIDSLAPVSRGWVFAKSNVEVSGLGRWSRVWEGRRSAAPENGRKKVWVLLRGGKEALAPGTECKGGPPNLGKQKK